MKRQSQAFRTLIQLEIEAQISMLSFCDVIQFCSCVGHSWVIVSASVMLRLTASSIHAEN